MTDRAKWNPDEYASATAHHRAYDDALLDPITITPDATILDLGSGVGDLTRRLAALAPTGTVLGLDRSRALVDSARHAYRDVSNVAFSEGSAEHLIGLEPTMVANGDRTGPPFDLVISTATLHWVPKSRHRAVYDGVFGVLRPGGVFRAEFGGSGQIAHVRAVLDPISAELGGPVSPWYFPTPDEVEEPIREAGFTLDGGFCRLVEQRRSFPQVADFEIWLRSQVLNAYEPDLPAGTLETFTRRAIDRLATEGRASDGSYDQTYVRLDLLALRPEGT